MSRGKWIIAGIVIAFVLFLVGTEFWTYRERWEDGGFHYTQIVRRIDGRPLSVFIHGDDYTASGPVSESGKPHGEWSVRDGGLYSQPKWYWYGEEVTEGEWHEKQGG